MKVMLVGPVKYWWDHWETPEHARYINWRNQVSQSLVDAGHLVYRPHEAWKGQWDESAQAVNDVAIRICDVLVNIAPPNVYSFGTDDEIDYARRYNKKVLDFPCPPSLLPFGSVMRSADEFAHSLDDRLSLANEGTADLHIVARQLLHIIDSGTTPDSMARETIISRARDLLGVNTPEKENA